MKKIGLLIELKSGRLKPANLGMITAARADGHELHAILPEPLTEAVASELAAHGVDTIVRLNMADPSWHPHRWAKAVATALPGLGIRTLLGLTTARGRDLLPRIAAMLDAPLVMDCLEVDIDGRQVKTSQYSGKAIATLRLMGDIQIIGLRPNAVDAIALNSDPRVMDHPVPIEADSGLIMLEAVPGSADEQNLSEADVIIAGGRGLKNGDNFKLLHDCVRHIEGAAVGASRVAVDEGWAPYPMQVGQTGTKVNPKVYIACGISGSVQHFAGMKTAGMIIAVNSDADAAIMEKCDYYVRADLFDILPELARQLSAATSP